MKINKKSEKTQDAKDKDEVQSHSEFYFPFFEKHLGALKKDFF